MGHSALREAAARGTVALGRSGLVVLAFGNLSVADHSAGIMAIKASGADHGRLSPDTIAVLDIASGDVLEGAGRGAYYGQDRPQTPDVPLAAGSPR